MTAWLRAVVAVAVAALVTATAGAGLVVGVSTAQGADRPADWFARQRQLASDHTWPDVTLAQLREQLRQQARRTRTGERGATGAVPFSAYRIRLAPDAAPDAAALASGRYFADTVVRYRLAGEGVSVTRQGHATFALTRSGWRLRDTSGDRRDLWEHERVDVIQAGRSAVIGSNVLGADLGELSAQVEQARNIVDDFWTARWPSRVVVVLPGKPRTMNALIGRPNAWRLPAVTSWESGRDGPVARVTINPKLFYSLPAVGRQIILRHEITHLAQDALPARRAPLWLSEGLAEYVGYRGSGVPAEVIAGSALDRVREGSLPSVWPTDADFHFGLDNSERTLGYEYGWAACQMIAERYGEDALVPFYHAVVTGSGSRTQRVDTAAADVLGVDGPILVEQWQTWLMENA